MDGKRCKFADPAHNGHHCGSYAFNLARDGIKQGEYCDVHYWRVRCEKAEAAALSQPAAANGVRSPKEPPKLYQKVIALTTDIDDDPIWVTATYNGEKYGYLGTGGHCLKPVTAWHALPPAKATP